jgi:tRNA dimethylallyltransferase
MQNTLIILLGPTGIGKTDLSLELATHFQSEIISCDSRQIFREMIIGTAVPDQKTLGTVPHHFIGSHSINDYYNASKFEIEVLHKLDQLFRGKELVMMTGGSMLYIEAICKGLDDLPDVDPQLRKSLMNRMETDGIASLLIELEKLDPLYYQEVDLKNPKRILHALEICLSTGTPFSAFRTNQTKKRPFNIIKIGLNCDRAVLYNRINQRVDKMFGEGLVDEAKNLYPSRHLNALNTVGYRELFDYFDGKLTLDEAREKIKANSRKYARKQLTWFRRDPDITWFTPGMGDEIISFINRQLERKGDK